MLIVRTEHGAVWCGLSRKPHMKPLKCGFLNLKPHMQPLTPCAASFGSASFGSVSVPKTNHPVLNTNKEIYLLKHLLRHKTKLSYDTNYKIRIKYLIHESNFNK